MKQIPKIILWGGIGLLSTSVYGEEDKTSAPIALDDSAVADSQTTESSSDAVTGTITEASEKLSAKMEARTKQSGPSAMTRSEPLPVGAVISSGERVAIDGKGFSIVAPSGWVVRKNLPRASLFVQAQVQNSEYPRNISVVRFKDPRFISATSAQDFAERLVASFPQVSSTIEGYSLRSHEPIKMADGRDGWLFYTDFTDSGRKMMQAHVLVSSETNHYLATFTDVAEHFEGSNKGEQFLSEAWGAMTSIELDSRNPSSGIDFQLLLGIFLGFSSLIVALSLGRKYMAKKYYRSMSDQEEFSDDLPGESAPSISSTFQSGHSKLAASGISARTRPTKVTTENIDEMMDDPVKSGVSRIIKFKAKQVSTTPDDDDLEFETEDASKRFKRGA